MAVLVATLAVENNSGSGNSDGNVAALNTFVSGKYFVLCPGTQL
jgi:hypothetical protein